MAATLASPRGTRKYIISTLEARLVRMEKAVADIAGRLEEEIPKNDALKAILEELKGDF